MFEDFSTDDVRDPLMNNSISSVNGSCVIHSGSIDLYAFDFENLVFEVENNFIPTSSNIGGIRLLRGEEKRNLFEVSTNGDEVTHVRLVKDKDKYSGWGSYNGRGWFEVGTVLFPNCEKIGVTAIGDYELSYIKLYEKDTIRIKSVAPEWTVLVYVDGELIGSQPIVKDFVDVRLPFYPFTGRIVVKNHVGDTVIDQTATDFWGGDEFKTAHNVNIYKTDHTRLSTTEDTYLGSITAGMLEEKFYIKNEEDNPVTVTLRVAEYSEFKDWALLSLDGGEAYESSLEITMLPGENVFFWVLVSRPPVVDGGFDYENLMCRFFLEVV